MLIFGCRGGAVLADTAEALALTADLRVQFSKADDASNQAVMANTEEASIAFAKDAQKTTQIVDADVAKLGLLLKHLKFSSEQQALDGFEGRWTQYKTVDRDILALAVENTNLKAQRLSFGLARDAADAFRDATAMVAAGVAGKDHCAADQLAVLATLAVREIQVLQAPHIAEPDDAAMTRLEQDLANLDVRARDALKALSKLAQPSAGPTLGVALAALDRFKDISGQIVTLSRRNSNVRSLELALRQKPKLVAACDETLLGLQRQLENEGSKATR